MKISGTVLVQANVFTGKKGGKEVKPDKNGLMPVIFTAVAGELPSLRTISGTIAKSLNINPIGELYLLDYNEVEPVEIAGKTVRNFRWLSLGGEVTDRMEILNIKKSLGAGVIKPVGNGDVEIIPDPATPTTTPVA